jgi:hypothetical protein
MRRIAALVVIAISCAAAGATLPGYQEGDWLFVVTSEYDYAAGAFSAVDMDPLWPHWDNLGTTHGDAIARAYGGLIYLIERFGADNIRVIDPAQGFATVRQFSVGAGSNPQDICFVNPGRAFVTRYERAELWEVNPLTGAHTGTVDLAPLADADGIPEMHMMTIRGDRLFVTVQRLDRDYYWIPVPPSYLAVIDLADNRLLDMDPEAPGVQGVPLAGTCPNSGIRIDPARGDFLVGETGTYGATDGGLERIDPETLQSRGWVVTEATLGGNLNVWDTADGVKGFAVVLTPEWATQVVAFDVRTGATQGTVALASEYAYTHLLVDPPRQQLFVCDRSYAAPGIRVYRTTDHAPLTAGPIPVGLYPYWMVDMHGPDTGAPEEPSAAAPPDLSVSPRPATGPVTIRFELARAGTVELRVLDAAGRQVATLCRGPRAPGRHTLAWDPDATGAGVYFLRLQTEAGIRLERILRLE